MLVECFVWVVWRVFEVSVGGELVVQVEEVAGSRIAVDLVVGFAGRERSSAIGCGDDDGLGVFSFSYACFSDYAITNIWN